MAISDVGKIKGVYIYSSWIYGSQFCVRSSDIKS